MPLDSSAGVKHARNVEPDSGDEESIKEELRMNVIVVKSAINDTAVTDLNDWSSRNRDACDVHG